MSQGTEERRPRGRRPGGADTRGQVLAAARARFAAQGYDATTVRQVAGDAGVDPALVHHYFGTKADLFVAAVEYPVNPAEVVAALVAVDRAEVGERLLRLFLERWDAHAPSPLFALLRSAGEHEQAAAMLREFITREVVGRLARELGLDRPALRASLCGSQVVGLALVRYVLRLEPLASADADTVVACIAPTLQRYLTGPLP
jgi:AcrR family transcriptional regulator